MGDQIIPYLAIAGNSEIKTVELTCHAVTNIYIAEMILEKKKLNVNGKIGEIATIKVN